MLSGTGTAIGGITFTGSLIFRIIITMTEVVTIIIYNNFSMCYQASELWLSSMQARSDDVLVDDARIRLKSELSEICSEKSFKFFAKRLAL
ncbi:hypothetical protein DP091_19530 [Paenibacillus sp. MDMC362]|nr:hypothetical protein DP091_19530 [Paenibacillus sp. MDMC362]